MSVPPFLRVIVPFYWTYALVQLEVKRKVIVLKLKNGISNCKIQDALEKQLSQWYNFAVLSLMGKGELAMNYNKLWKLLIDKNMLRKDLQEKAGISSNAIAKMGKGGDVSTQILRKICEALDCQIEDICELD